MQPYLGLCTVMNILRTVSRTKFLLRIPGELYLVLEKSLSFCCEYAVIKGQTANIQQSLFCQTNFVRWVFVTRREYIVTNYCEQCSSQNIRSIFVRYSNKDSFSARENLIFPPLLLHWTGRKINTQCDIIFGKYSMHSLNWAI